GGNALSIARCAGEYGAARRSVRRKHQESLPSARCADLYGASRTFIVHHARCAERVVRRAYAKSI
ncbi:hypothetical protein A2U01_0074899, partial [Trifolium medium]|nr:hypothetical protein [Trifolium medium]